MAGIDNLKPFQPGDDPRRYKKQKGTIHLSTHIQNMLNDEEFSMWLSDPKDGFKEYKGAPMKAIIMTAIKLAADKSKEGAAAREWLAKYGYGQKFELEHSGEIATGVADPQLAAEFSKYLKEKK